MCPESLRGERQVDFSCATSRHVLFNAPLGFPREQDPQLATHSFVEQTFRSCANRCNASSVSSPCSLAANIWRALRMDWILFQRTLPKFLPGKQTGQDVRCQGRNGKQCTQNVKPNPTGAKKCPIIGRVFDRPPGNDFVDPSVCWQCDCQYRHIAEYAGHRELSGWGPDP